MVRSVCGDATERCALAMGDWNVPGEDVAGLWDVLIGGGAPSRPLGMVAVQLDGRERDVGWRDPKKCSFRMGAFTRGVVLQRRSRLPRPLRQALCLLGRVRAHSCL